MEAITTIGLDIAKSVFQAHGVDAAGTVVVRRQLKRRYVVAFFQKAPPCLVGIEACATWHHGSREIAGSWPYRAADAAGAQLRMLKAQILGLDRRIMAWHRPNGTSQRLDQFPVLVRLWPRRWSRACPIQRCLSFRETLLCLDRARAPATLARRLSLHYN